MSLSQTVLVLFDIDGTLVDTTGAGVRGMNTAFERLHGRPAALEGITVAGRTDLAILAEVYEASGIGFHADHVPALRDAYLTELRREMSRGDGPGFGVLPGVHGALDALDDDPAFTLGLLTGNFAGGAEIKLGHFDLWRRFRIGAFGDAHTNRHTLQLVRRVGTAAARLAIEIDAIEARVHTKHAECNANVESITEAALCTFDQDVIALARCSAERSRRHRSGSTKPNGK